MPRRKDAKVAIDGRFSRMLEDDDFAQKASVDRYGRKLAKDAGKEEIKRYYRMQSDDDDDEEAAAAESRYDPARGEGVVSSEESSDESDDEADVAAEAIAREQLDAANSIPTGDVTKRLAAVNLDWDNVGATDLMKAFSSFAPSGGKVLRVTIYPSEFGRERMERENVEGPPSDIFKSRDQPIIDSDNDDNDDYDDDVEITAKDLIKEDKGEEFDSGRLRNYQLERLRYFYAVIECDAPSTAHHIYDQCDGAEYEATANFFDLRFIPDDTSFEHDAAHDVCTTVPQNYKPNDFVTDALQHSKVKLTWDEDDPQRKQASKRAFSQREVEDMDLQAYLASDTESEREDAGAKYRTLLAGVSMGGRKTNTEDMEVTFTAGLSEKEKGAPVIEEDDDVLESTISKYARKERERKLRRKEKARLARGLEPLAKGLEPLAKIPTPEEEPAREETPAATDLGFADPFFADAPSSATAAKKDKKRKAKAAKAALAADQASKRAELELLMMDHNEAANDGSGPRHFDMKQVVKSEKKKTKKHKKQSREAAEAMEEGAQPGFEIDVKDPRFAAVYEKHEFAIDPTNPRFTKTSAMKKMMDERRKRTQQREGEAEEEGGKRKKVKVGDERKAASEEVRRLVQSIKNKSKR